jgi:hypothetical protein
MTAKTIAELIPAFVMRKEFTEEMIRNLRLGELPELDLRSFPIVLKQGSQERLI